MMTLGNKRLTIALAISLGLNLFLGGFWAARCTAQGMRGPHPRGAVSSFEGDFAQAPGLRRVLGDRAQLRPKREALREARRAAFAAFKAPEFDRPAASGALQRLRNENVALQEAIHGALLEAAAGMPLEERRRLVRHEGRAGRP